jgi:hypothetical protein
MVEILLDAEYQIKGQALEFDFKVDKNIFQILSPQDS